MFYTSGIAKRRKVLNVESGIGGVLMIFGRRMNNWAAVWGGIIGLGLVVFSSLKVGNVLVSGLWDWDCRYGQ